MRIALIKMSSMGDVIHALPVVTDVLRAHPGAQIDWIIEPPFAPLARLHPGVADIIPVALRRWRRQWRQPQTRAAFRAVRQDMAARHYDLILDLQGLLKSAWVACWAHGPRAGYTRACAREPLASWVYQRRYQVDMNVHAIEKMRSLAGQALGFTPSGLPVFDLQAPAEPAEPVVDVAAPYWVFLHATSRAEKLWPAASAQAFLQQAGSRGMPVLLPWGNEAERQAAHDLSTQAGHGTVLPALDLGALAGLLARAEAVVGVDTGLTHLAAALDRPVVALFAATEAARYGPYWSAHARSLGQPGQWPQADEVLTTIEQLLANAS